MSDNPNEQVFKGPLRLDHKGHYYVNEVYPNARRMWSRPYSVYHHINRSPRFAFEDALFNMGKDLVGHPFQTSLDLEAYLPRWATTPHWNHDRIAAFSQTDDYQVWLQDRSPQAASAANFITASLRDISSYYAARQNVYAGLREPFLSFWQDEPMLDPRLALAEELFVSCKTDGSLRALQFDDEERLATSLNWMARPENARRIGQMFLYSRLAQHFGETDPASFTFSNAVMHDIVAGSAAQLIRRLQQNPVGYFQEKTGGAPTDTTDLSCVCRGMLSLRNAWQSAQFFVGISHGILNAGSLARTAGTIVSDFERLHSGMWAKGKLHEMGFAYGSPLMWKDTPVTALVVQ